MNQEFMFVLGCLTAGHIVVFSWLWCVIHAGEAATERWLAEGQEAIRAMGISAEAD